MKLFVSGRELRRSDSWGGGLMDTLREASANCWCFAEIENFAHSLTETNPSQCDQRNLQQQKASLITWRIVPGDNEEALVCSKICLLFLFLGKYSPIHISCGDLTLNECSPFVGEDHLSLLSLSLC